MALFHASLFLRYFCIVEMMKLSESQKGGDVK